MKDYYKIIGVDRNANPNSIKNAYLLKIKKYHPDIYSGDKLFAENKTSELNEAYNVLKDDEQREKYDKMLDAVYKKQQSYKHKEESGSFNYYLEKVKAFFKQLGENIKGAFSDLKQKAKNKKASAKAQKANSKQQSSINEEEFTKESAKQNKYEKQDKKSQAKDVKQNTSQNLNKFNKRKDFKSASVKSQKKQKLMTAEQKDKRKLTGLIIGMALSIIAILILLIAL